MCTSNGRCGFLIAPDCISNRSSVCQVSQTLPNGQVVWTKNAFNHNSLRLGHAPSNTQLTGFVVRGPRASQCLTLSNDVESS